MKYKILFLLSSRHEASSRFRVDAYVNKLQEDFAIRLEYLSEKPKFLPKFLKRTYKMILLVITALRVKQYDVVFMHRIVSSYKDNLWFEKMLHKWNKNIIFDFDDAIFMHNEHKVSSVIFMSSVVLAGNGYLQKYALQSSRNVLVLPTVIDTDKFTIKEIVPTQNITIGWTGTSSNYQFFSDNLIKELKVLLEKYRNVRFLFICDKLPDARFNFNYEFTKWTHVSEVEDLKLIDIGIMPLVDNEWTRGKCGFKLIQYGSIGIPSLGSNVGVNNDIIDDCKTGYLIGNDSWYEKLEILITDFELRKKMGQEGRKKIEATYSLKVNYEVLKKSLLDSVQQRLT